MELVKKYLTEFSKIADEWFDELSWLEERYVFYQEFFNEENLEKAEWEDFQNLGKHIHSFNSMSLAKARALGNMNLPIEEYRRIFRYIISNEHPINITINNLFKKHEGKYVLPYFGESSVSELIAYAFPDKYVMYNSRDVEALKFLGLTLPKVKGEKFGDTFLRYNDFLKDILILYKQIVGQKTDTTVQLELDQFFSWISSVKAKELSKNKPTISKSHQETKTLFEEYLKRVIPRSARNYLSAVPTIDKIAKNNALIHSTLYEIQESTILEEFMKKLSKIEAYKERNEVGHGMFRAALGKYAGFLKELSEENIIHNQTGSLNMIYYGPPGTGKTYKTVEQAVNIVEGRQDPISRSRESIRKKFNQYFDQGLIRFTTFHQSFSYEDFVEGIKPVLDDSNDDSDISYTIEDGIFKQICKQVNIKKQIQSEPLKDISKRGFYKMSLGGKNRSEVHEWCLDNNILALGWGRDKDFTQLNEIDNWQEFKSEVNNRFPDLAEESKYNTQAMFSFINMKIGDIVFISKGNKVVDAIGVIEGEYEYSEEYPIDYYQYRKVKWLSKYIGESPEVFLSKNISQQTIYEINSENVKIESLEAYLNPNKSESSNYVLIIDEINRGNVSSIFGELITLIEADKRLGNSEETKVTLPYSKTRFGVPSNLYIIGTMNTADKSVEALDSALRRRFSFEEIPPDPSLIDKHPDLEVDLQLLLNTINQRIEVLLDKNHTIGHSYFMNVSKSDNPEEELRRVFSNKIIPLLEEYFYGDLSKIGLILGNRFVQRNDKDVSSLWAKGDFDEPDIPENSLFQLNDPLILSMEDYMSIYEK